jgi:hypothetical protein
MRGMARPPAALVRSDSALITGQAGCGAPAEMRLRCGLCCWVVALDEQVTLTRIAELWRYHVNAVHPGADRS